MTTREGVTAKVAVEVVCVGRVREEITDSGEDTATVVVVEGRVEHIADVGGGKKIPFGIGRGSTGFSALPTTWPSPGNFLAAGKILAGAATVVGAAAGTAVTLAGLAAKAAALAAWWAAALSLFLAWRPGPRRLAPS